MRKRSFLWIVLGLIVSLAFVAATAAQDAPAATPEAEAAMPEAGETRPIIGITVADAENGVEIGEVLAGSGADEAGLEAGDIITAVNGEAVSSAQAIAEFIAGLSVGDTVTLTIERGGEEQTVEVTLGEAPVQPAAPDRPGRGPRMFMQVPGELGLSYDAANDTWTITELSEDSPLYAAGLRAGDVITAVDGEPRDPMALLPYIARLDEDAAVTLSIERDGEAQEIEFTAGDLVSLGMMMMFEEMPMMPGQRGQGPDRFNMPMIPGMPGQGGMMMMGGNGRLGVTFVTLDEQVANERGVEQTEGALVVSVIEGSPAAEAGLMENDVITAVNAEPVDEERTLRDRLFAYEPGDTVTLDVIRDGAAEQIEVTLGQPEMGEFMPFGMFEGRGNGMFRMNPDGDMFGGLSPEEWFERFHPPIDDMTPEPARPNV